MTMEEVQERFVNEIRLRGTDDHYIDRNEEREILQIAIQMGFSLESARAALAQVCRDSGYILESGILRIVKEKVETAAGSDGRLDRREFDVVLAATRELVSGKKSDRDVKKLIVTVMEDTGYSRVKKGWFGNWYKSLKKELGMV